MFGVRRKHYIFVMTYIKLRDRPLMILKGGSF